MCNRFGFIQMTRPDGTTYWVRDIGPGVYTIDAPSFLKFPKAQEPREQIYPADGIVTLRTSDDKIIISAMKWGWKPKWAKSILTNSQSERLADSKVWRKAVEKNHRAIIPVSFFYEWQEITGQQKKKRWKITVGDTDIFWFAGLYEEEDGINCISLLTQKANPLMAKIHNSGGNKERQPLVLREDTIKIWLDTSIVDATELMKKMNLDQPSYSSEETHPLDDNGEKWNSDN